LLPFIPLLSYVTAWQFYFLCIIQGLIISFIDYRNFKAIQTWGAEAVSSLHPFSVFVVFLLWLMLNPEIMINYTDNLWRFTGIIFSLSGIIYAVSSLKKSVIGRDLLIYLCPYFLGAALCDVINKLCMSYVGNKSLLSASCIYIVITGLVVTIVNTLIFIKNNNKINEIFKYVNLKYSLLVILLIGSMISKNFAMFDVSNPSFVSATLYLYIIWIMLTGKILQKYGKFNKYCALDYKKVFILLICAVCLVLLDNK
ncbi:MAG: hypothetical protein IJ677_03215, partial [Alphaproteobacteria bacterium]|nr:hypothetical protein [Alphaproteobacteria bacterium]